MSTKPGFIRIPVTYSAETPEQQQEPVHFPVTKRLMTPEEQQELDRWNKPIPITYSPATSEQQQESATLSKTRHIVMRQMPADESTRQRLLQDLVRLRERYSSSFGSIPELEEFQAALDGAIKALINRTDAS